MAFKKMPTMTAGERAAHEAEEQARLDRGLRERHLEGARETVEGTVAGPVEVRHEHDGGHRYGFRLLPDGGGAALAVELLLKPWQEDEAGAIEAVPDVWDGPSGLRLRLGCARTDWRGRPMLTAVTAEVLPAA